MPDYFCFTLHSAALPKLGGSLAVDAGAVTWPHGLGDLFPCPLLAPHTELGHCYIVSGTAVSGSLHLIFSELRGEKIFCIN